MTCLNRVFKLILGLLLAQIRCELMRLKIIPDYDLAVILFLPLLLDYLLQLCPQKWVTSRPGDVFCILSELQIRR